MDTNPYQPPATSYAPEPEPPPPSEPLRYPAYGCVVTAFLILAVGYTYVHLMFGIEQALNKHHFPNQYVTPTAVEVRTQYLIRCAPAIVLFILINTCAACMLNLWNRWYIVSCACLLFPFIFTTPLAAIILYRINQKEVWDSFVKHPVKLQ